MASPPCCPPNSTPPLQKSTPPSSPKGEFLETTPGRNNHTNTKMQVYCTGHKDLSTATGVVLVFSDVFGYTSGRHLQFADQLGDLLNNPPNNKDENKDENNDEGETSGKYTVLAPDYFLGKPPFKEYSYLPLTFSFLMSAPGLVYSLKTKGPSFYTSPVFDILLPWLQDDKGVQVEQVGLSWVGFCFGGFEGFKCMQLANAAMDDADAKSKNDTTTTTDAEEEEKSKTSQIGQTTKAWRSGVAIHPSLQPEQLAGGNDQDLASTVSQNKILLLPAKNDADNLKPGGSIVQLFAKEQKEEEGKISVVFEDMVHGWCSRGDEKVEGVKEAQQEAQRLAAEYIRKHHHAVSGEKQ